MSRALQTSELGPPCHPSAPEKGVAHRVGCLNNFSRKWSAFEALANTGDCYGSVWGPPRATSPATSAETR